jgi:hypothetical protein
MVVMIAPRRPVLKNFCQATETPQRVSSSIDIDIQRVTRAMKNMQDTTQS